LIKGLEVFNPKSGKLKLIFGMNMELLGKTFDQIKIGLSKRYESNLFNEKFSYENREWKIFTEKEKDIILSLNKN